MKKIIFAIVATFYACVVSPISRADVVMPLGTATTEGFAANCIPFNCFMLHYQQVYDAASFGTSPIEIVGIAFRGDETVGDASGSYTATIGLSTTSSAVDGLSTTFASNTGADALTVFNGIVTIATTAGPGPRPFDFVINLTKPFVYDPARGNLLLDVVPEGTTVGPFGVGFFDASFTLGDDTSRLLGDPTALVGFADTGGLVTKFITAPAVPEPTTGMLVALGLAGIALARRRPFDGDSCELATRT